MARAPSSSTLRGDHLTFALVQSALGMPFPLPSWQVQILPLPSSPLCVSAPRKVPRILHCSGVGLLLRGVRQALSGKDGRAGGLQDLNHQKRGSEKRLSTGCGSQAA